MLAALLCTMQVAFASEVKVLNAIARASLTPTAKTGAVYISAATVGDEIDRLVSITTPAASSAQVHETIMEGDVMKMRPLVGGWELVPGRIYAMEPGKTHIMLTGLKAPLKKGDVVVLELVFEKAGVVKVDVPVGDVAAGHQHGD
jgi:periplasmic copper chaperone A